MNIDDCYESEEDFILNDENLTEEQRENALRELYQSGREILES